MKKTKIQTNKIFARHLPYLPVSVPCDFFPLPPNEIQTQRRTGVLEAAQHSWLDLPHCIQMLQSSSLLTVWLWGTNLWCTTSLLNLLVFLTVVSLCWYLWLGAPPVCLELWTLPLTTAVRSLSSPGDDPQHKNLVILMQKSRFPLCTSLKSVVREGAVQMLQEHWKRISTS